MRLVPAHPESTAYWSDRNGVLYELVGRDDDRYWEPTGHMIVPPPAELFEEEPAAGGATVRVRVADMPFFKRFARLTEELVREIEAADPMLVTDGILERAAVLRAELDSEGIH